MQNCGQNLNSRNLPRLKPRVKHPILPLVHKGSDCDRLFGSTTWVTRVSLTDMRNINNPALQAERFVLLSDKSNLFYRGHTGLRSRTVRCQ